MKQTATLATLALALWALPCLAGMSGGGGGPAEIAGVVGLTPVGERSCLAAWVSVPGGQALAGVGWYNNDEQTVFPQILVVVGTGLLVGLLSGAGVWAFKQLIDLAHLFFFDLIGVGLRSLGGWTLGLIPVLGGLAVGLIAHFWIGEERHHGVAGIMESAALAGGRLRYQRIPAKSAAAALSIGSGASVGPEDPSVQIGSNLGSMFGQWLHMSDERTRALVAAGAASGIAAAFNAPIAGVFFALEIILGEIGGSAFGIVVIASVISAIFTQAVAGSEPAFHVPAYAFGSPLELPLELLSIPTSW